MKRYLHINEAMTPDEILKMYYDGRQGSSDVNKPQTPHQHPNVEKPTTSQPTAPEPQQKADDASDGTPSDGGRMVVDEKWMRKWYDIFNEKYWNSQLPHNMAFETNNSSRSWGRAAYSFARKNGYCQTPLFNFKISLSNYNESPEHVKKATLLHEMIHIADYVFHPEHFIANGRKVGKRNYDAHGPVFFLKEAERLKKDGWDIQKFVSDEERNASQLTAHNQELLDTRKSNAVAAVLVYDNYKFIVKTDMEALNSLISHIREYWPLFGARGLKRIDCYKTHNDWFNSQRSRRTRVVGWKCSTEEEFRDKFNKWHFDEYPFKTIILGE